MKKKEFILAGIDIGGTKCSVSLGKSKNGKLSILDKTISATSTYPHLAIKDFLSQLDLLLKRNSLEALDAVGISCGSPLNSKAGIIMNPPNLPGWVNVDIVTPFIEKYRVPAKLKNDANACALAEWKSGAGLGHDNLVFLTFGTGMGAGLILDGKLYEGKSDSAGEIGHVSLERYGPLGYGKYGSFEGFCSGGGIAQLGKMRVTEAILDGRVPAFCPLMEQVETITAQSLNIAAEEGDALAIDIYREVGEKLGQGISVLIDILNPDVVIIGSIYVRAQKLLEPGMSGVIKKQSLMAAREHCQIVPAGLGERVGDYGALTIAQLLAMEEI